MLRSVFVISCLYMALMPSLSSAITPEQKAKIHEHFESIGKICIKDNTITEEDIAALRAKEIPTGPNSGCFVACMMKQIGVMDDAGMMQKETALEMAKSVFDDADELKLIEEFIHSCAHVNKEAVTDGDKGCERALISLKCMKDNAPQFGFDI